MRSLAPSRRDLNRPLQATVAALLAAVLALSLALASGARANGGQVRVAAERAGPYEVTVFTSPAPLRAGELDVSVLLQRPGSPEIVEDARIAVVVTTAGGATVGRFPATREQATNKLYYAAKFPLEQPGHYRITVEISGPEGSGAVGFEAAVEPAPSSAWWRSWWLWGTLALLQLPLIWWLFGRHGTPQRGRRPATVSSSQGPEELGEG
jgi:hypothetical protein